MKAITLRNLPPTVARTIEQRAADTGKSLNRTVIELLEQGLGLSGEGAKRIRHDDLDALAGTWSEEEATELDRALAAQRPIEPEHWR